MRTLLIVPQNLVKFMPFFADVKKLNISLQAAFFDYLQYRECNFLSEKQSSWTNYGKIFAKSGNPAVVVPLHRKSFFPISICQAKIVNANLKQELADVAVVQAELDKTLEYVKGVSKIICK